MIVERMAADEWIFRSAEKIARLDPDISVDEAIRIATDMHRVERLAAMDPEAAVDFVQQQLTSEQPDKYERRTRAR